MKSIDEVKSQIEPILKHQMGQQVAQKKAEALLKDARAQGLDAAAATQGVPVINSDFFGRKDMLPGLGPATAIYGCGVQRSRQVAARYGSGISGHGSVPIAGD